MKAALITEEQIKALIEIRNVLKRLNRHNHAEELDGIVKSLKVQEPVAHVSDRENCRVWWSDKFTHISQAPEDNTPLYAGKQP